MFTGIVEELGKIKKIVSQAGIKFLEISAQEVLAGTKIGDSIAVNGVCLTVVSLGRQSVGFQVMEITHKTTNLGLLKTGQLVNLERSLKLGDRVSGHFVSGHIDCLGKLCRKILRNGNLELGVALPPLFMKYCLAKGSIALDGVSLTLANRRANLIQVNIIPHTFKNSTLSFKVLADKLNVEFDILAKKTTI